MSGLHAGWLTRTLGDLAEFIMGQAPPGSECNKVGIGTPFVKAGEFGPERPFIREWTTRPLKYALPSDVLICVVGATCGKINLGADCAIGRSVAAIRPTTALDQQYLFGFMSTKVRELRAASIGSAQGVISKDHLASVSLPLPPLAEQRRIVAKINSLTGKSRRARDHLDHIPRLAEKYKQAILAAAFRGDLTREWRDARGLPGPRSVLLGDVAEGFTYGSAAKSAKQGRVPVLRMGNIQDGKLDWEDLVFTDDAAEIAKYGLKVGDVLFNRTNSPALVGKTALFRGEREAIYAGYLIKVRCKSELLPEFLTYCLNAPDGRAYSWEVKTDGVSQSNINAKKLAAFRFDLPSAEEQAEIVRRIEATLSWINRVTGDASGARSLIDRLDQSLLAKAFRGELVSQDPTDEPASILLERIRAERAAPPRAKHGRNNAS